MKINEIIGAFDQNLEEHLALYLGDENPDISEWEFTDTGGDQFSAQKLDQVFLNTNGTLSALLQKEGDEFVFCMFTPKASGQSFAKYFPFMLPFDHKNAEETGTLPQPNLMDLHPSEIQWLYLYFSSDNIKTNSSLWQKINDRNNANVLNDIIKQKGDFSTNQARIEYLQFISWIGNDLAYDPWQGGFYYFGRFTAFPLKSISEISENPGFLKISETIAEGFVVHGCVGYPRFFPYLNFQVPLADISIDFLSGSLSLQISAPSRFYQNPDRKIGIAGNLDFGNNFNLKIKGDWPLDSDTVTAQARAEIQDIPYFDNSVIPGLEHLPVDLAIDLQLEISKSNAALMRMAFKLEVAQWDLIQDVLSLEQLKFNLSILQPGRLNLLIASVSANALLGKSKTRFICSGTYPEGYFSFQLDPNTPIQLHELIEGFLGSTDGMATNLRISAFSGEFSYRRKYLSFKAAVASGSDKKWKPGAHDFELENLQLGIHGSPGLIGGYLKADLNLSEVSFKVEAVYEQGWFFSAMLIGTVNLNTLLINLGADIQNVPDILGSFEFGDLTLSFNTHSKDFEFSGEGSITDPSLDIKLIVQLKQLKTGAYEKHFSGQITVGDRQFDLIFDSKKPKNKLLLASYQKPGGEKIPLNSLLKGLLPSGLDISPELAFSVKNALLVLAKTPPEGGGAPVSKFLFSSEIDLGIDLSSLGKLPIVGEKFSGQDALSLSFQPVISSKKNNHLLPADIEDIRKILPEGSPVLPDELGDGGFGLITTLHWGAISKTLKLGIKSGDVDAKLPADTPAANGNVAAGAAPAPAAGEQKWVDVKKNFGALQISRVGLSYVEADKKIKIILDGGLSIGPLQVALAGLGAAYSLSDKSLSVSLDGLGLSFKKDPLEISGGFIKMNDDYVGRVTIRAESFAIMALGAFSTFKGQPSFFIYAYLDYPLGGPTFFFVEGLSLGFGYNRRLDVPPVEQLRTFPLISEVIGPAKAPPAASASLTPAAGQKSLVEKLTTEFETLGKYIYPQEGQYFLAVGIKFNSFKTIDSFALLTIGFGQHLNFGLMGISKLTVPALAPTPVAEVEMAFSVRFDPEEGFLAVQAVLTPNSYIFSGLCKLQGGFAFFSWFKGEHGGDFVVSLGGYHPNFPVPAHYPQPAVVPRLSYSWQLSDHMSLKGVAYFAITPKAMMLGGRLEAAYKNEFDSIRVEANFAVGADFLIYWKPFHYEAFAFAEISASVSWETLFGDVTIEISAGAQLQLWGPPLGGTAYVHAKIFGIKTNFTIDVGAGRSVPAKLSWPEFKAAFLPANVDKTGISIAVQSGLVQSIKVKEGNTETEVWIINPKEFKLVLSSIAPVTTDDIFIDPMENTKVGSVMTVKLSKTNKPDEVLKDEFLQIEFFKQYPKALWTDKRSIAGALPDISGPQTISLPGGFLLVPKMPPKSPALHFFRIGDLDYKVELLNIPARAFEVSYKRGDLAEKPLQTDTLFNTRSQRNNVLSHLGFDPNSEVDLQANLVDAFVSTPLVVALKS